MSSDPQFLGTPSDVEAFKARHGYRQFGEEAGYGGSAAQVFEVTDLLIPAGTDLGADPGHLLGTAVDVAPGRGLLFNVFLELAAPASDSLFVWRLEDEVSVTFVNSLAPGTLWLTGGSPIADWVGRNLDTGSATPASVSVGFGLETSGPTTSDITVVRARAACLVI